MIQSFVGYFNFFSWTISQGIYLSICTCVLLPSLLTGEESGGSYVLKQIACRCKTISAALMILSVAAIIIFWLGMPKINNAHVNQAGNERFAGPFQDYQQHTSTNTAAGVLLMHVLFHSVK